MYQVDTAAGRHVKTVHSSWARFLVAELSSGSTYKVQGHSQIFGWMVHNHEVTLQVNVRTENRHGRSDPLYLLVQTTSEPIKLLAETKVELLNIYNYLQLSTQLSTHIRIQVKETEQTESLSSLVAVMVGVAVSLVSILVMVVIAVLTTRSRAR